jgi:hypothetical protein
LRGILVGAAGKGGGTYWGEELVRFRGILEGAADKF